MPGYGRGRGMGLGRGMGYGRGIGYGRGRWHNVDFDRENMSEPESSVYDVTKSNLDINQLKEYARMLEAQLNEIMARIKELESQKEEGANYEGTAQKKAVVNEALCIGCRICERVCPTGAIRMEGRVAKVDESKCIGCGDCVMRCPRGAITLK